MPKEAINPVEANAAERLLAQLAASIGEGGYDAAFKLLYPRRTSAECRERYLGLIDLFKELYIDGAKARSPGGSEPGADKGGSGVGKPGAGEPFAGEPGAVERGSAAKEPASVEGGSGAGAGERRIALISAPGRTEICGNHTDHQHGNVLAAAIDLDVICLAAKNNKNFIRVKSVGHSEICVDINVTAPQPEERGNAASLIRGLAAWFTERGVKIGGFDAYTTSQVLVGSGLSSSAAFEVVIGTAMNALFGGGVSPLDIAVAGQFAENRYFGKPSGLMDQTASSVGGFVRIDFADPQKPIVEPIQYDLSANGLRLCVVNTKGTHADLIGEYASIPEEMRAVAAYFGKKWLRDVEESDFYKNLPNVRAALHEINADAPQDTVDAESSLNKTPVAADRAILRAMHFFNENRLVSEAAAALRAADAETFLDCLIRSGRSSFTYLQNIFAVTQPGDQGLSIALALSEMILRGNGGAWRVTGGGFAGTIMALVPEALHEKYKSALEAAFGEGSCLTLSIRKYGGTEVKPDIQ